MKRKLIISLPALAVLVAAAAALWLLLPKGLPLTLVSDQMEELPEGTAILFGENFTIGRIEGNELFADHVEYRATIFSKHRKVVNSSSTFSLDSRRENDRKVRIVRVETPDANAQPLERGAVVKIERRSIWDIFK